MSCWLHRGAICCARQLALGQPTGDFLRFPMRMVALLRAHGVEPLIVFDGGPMPMKARLDASRASEREQATKDGEYAKAVKITPAMVQRLIQWLRREKVAFIVAPFEADAQIVHLVMRGYCAAAITEDSDMLAYRCPAVLYKLSPETGHARLITWDGLRAAQDSKRKPLFDGEWEGEWGFWEDGGFAAMAILAGCDYLPSFPGCGIATAHKLMRASRSVERAIEKLQAKASKGRPPSAQQTEAYLLHFRRCQEVFDHARVWDPDAGEIVHLRPLPPHTRSNGEEYDYLGHPMDAALAREVCCDASRDPVTLLPVVEPPNQGVLYLPQFEDDDLQPAVAPASGWEPTQEKLPASPTLPRASDPLLPSLQPREHHATSRHFASVPSQKPVQPAAPRDADKKAEVAQRPAAGPHHRPVPAASPPRKMRSPAVQAGAGREYASRPASGVTLPLPPPSRVDNSFLQAFRSKK